MHYDARSIVPCNTDLLAEEEIQKDELVIAQNETFDETFYPAAVRKRYE